MRAAAPETRKARPSDRSSFRPGSTLRELRVRESDNEPIQAFEGICIARKRGGINEIFKVRKISGGVSAERTFRCTSRAWPDRGGAPRRLRRAKLYYLRNLRGKAARIRERRIVK